MISSNSQKFLFIVLFALMLTASCSFFQSNSNQEKPQNLESDIQTNIPFSTKEPETFQAEFIITTFLNGEKTERKNFVAQKGEKLIATYGVGSKDEISYLLRFANESFILKHSEKIFQKHQPIMFSVKDTLKSQWKNFLTTKWLNEKKTAGFKKVGTENNLTKYIVKLEDSKTSEILVFIDEKIPFPIKQEFYSVLDNEKTLSYSVEIKDFKTEVNDKLFELPKDYKEIN